MSYGQQLHVVLFHRVYIPDCLIIILVNVNSSFLNLVFVLLVTLNDVHFTFRIVSLQLNASVTMKFMLIVVQQLHKIPKVHIIYIYIIYIIESYTCYL